MVESILLRLDSEGFAERITEVIWLRHNGAGRRAPRSRLRATANPNRQHDSAVPTRTGAVRPSRSRLDRGGRTSQQQHPAERLTAFVRRRAPHDRSTGPSSTDGADQGDDGGSPAGGQFEIGGEVGLQDSLLFDRGIAAGAFPGATQPSDPGFNFNGNGLQSVNPTLVFQAETPLGRGISRRVACPPLALARSTTILDMAASC